ncbi:MAG: hypothetical protein ABJZ55_21835 [Fuerstiella sp.]
MLSISDQPDYLPSTLTVDPPLTLFGKPASWVKGYRSELVFVGKVFCDSVPIYVFGAQFDLEMENSWSHGECVILDYFVSIGGPLKLLRFSGDAEDSASSSKVQFRRKSDSDSPWRFGPRGAALKLKSWPHFEDSPLSFCGKLEAGLGDVAMKHFGAGFDFLIFCNIEAGVVAIWSQLSNGQTAEEHELEEAQRRSEE